MFKKELQEKFEKIFGVSKVTFDSPGESEEQGCLFISIESVKNSFKDKRNVAIINGSASMTAPGEKLPFGFFSKSIISADPELTKALFFFDIETNSQRIRDLIQRGFSFQYFFNGQYDPSIGTITSVITSVEENL